MHRKCLSLVLTILFAISVFPEIRLTQSSSLDVSLAAQYFQEAKTICTRDNGKLWGVSLCGPMLFVDRKTRTLAANQNDTDGHLTKQGDAFVGKLPDNVNIANTALDWLGIHWTMVVWPLPEDKNQRAQLMMHESWHRIQGTIGLPPSGPANNHLDSLEGRIWLQLEWRALKAALKEKGVERKADIKNALIFRSYRRELFPNAEAEERSLEMSEGLADYTGVTLSGAANRDQYTVEQVKNFENVSTFVRSFAYASGPAYGVLLDESGMEWRKGLKPSDDFGALLQKAYSIKLPQNIKGDATAAARKYDGQALIATETERDNNRKKRIAEYRARLVDGALLVLPLIKMNMQLNPNNLQPLDSLGTVYPNIRIVDTWGILDVTGGALMNSEFTRVYVPAPVDTAGQSIHGDGWTLELKPGWEIVTGQRKGDVTLKKKQ